MCGQGEVSAPSHIHGIVRTSAAVRLHCEATPQEPQVGTGAGGGDSGSSVPTGLCCVWCPPQVLVAAQAEWHRQRLGPLSWGRGQISM